MAFLDATLARLAALEKRETIETDRMRQVNDLYGEGIVRITARMKSATDRGHMEAAVSFADFSLARGSEMTTEVIKRLIDELKICGYSAELENIDRLKISWE